MRPEPFDTASMSFESGVSLSWTIVSLTASPCGSSVQVIRESPSSRSSGLNSLRHLSTSRRPGSISTTSPLSPTRPSGIISRHEAPGVHSDSCQVSTQYCRVNSGSIRACQSFSGVVRM